MPDLLFTWPLWFNLITGSLMAILGLARLKPHNIMAVSLGITELLLVVQLITTIVLVSTGHKAATDTVEFFIYVVTAMLIPPAAVFWALLERNSRWSSVIMGVAALSIAIMLVRMHQLWTGNFNL
jgi:hypothetical protein